MQKAAILVITDTADKICNQAPPLVGGGSDLKLSGEAQAALDGAIARVVDLGIKGAAKYTSDQYNNVLRSDLAKTIEVNTNCKLAVFNALNEKLLSKPVSTTGGPPPPKPAPPQPSPRPEDLQLTYMRPGPFQRQEVFVVFFDWGKSNVPQESGRIVSRAVAYAMTYTDTSIFVSGYVDTSGPPEDQETSEKRAIAVKDLLIKWGVPAHRIAVAGRGSSDLRRPTPDNVREPQNRRAEIVIEARR